MKNMKNLFEIFCYVVVVVCFGACTTDDGMLNLDVENAQTRAIVSEYGESISNPDLITDWENLSEIVLNSEKITSGVSVTTPWADGSSSPLPESFRKDIKKEDGWKMLFHTFKRTGLDPKQNYMCFYNQYTGFIKIFYYYEGEQKFQGVQWYIKTNAGASTKILDAPSYLSKPMSYSPTNNMLLFSNMTSVPTTGIQPGWNGFEFQVPGYCIDLTSMDFTIGTFERQITNYDLLGKETLTTLGTITTTTQSSSGTSKALANIAGPEAKKYIDKLGKNLLGEMVVLGKNLGGLISSIPGSGYISVFKSGLDMIFGKSTTTSTSDVKLTTTGTVELGGTSSTETTTGIPSLNFNLYEALNPKSVNSNPNLVTAFASNSVHHLGVWTLKQKPVAYYDRVTMLTATRIGTSADGEKMSIQCSTRLPAIQKCDFEAIINPDLEPYITKKSFSIKYVVCDRMQGQSYRPFAHDISDALSDEVLFSDSEIVLKALPTAQYTFSTLVDNLPNQSYFTFFYDWGEIIDGRLLAVISLNMTCVCEGKETEIYQSQVYEVDSSTSSNMGYDLESVHHPPYSIVVNYGYPYTMRYNWCQPYK